MIKINRVYEKPAQEDGWRVLVVLAGSLKS